MEHMKECGLYVLVDEAECKETDTGPSYRKRVGKSEQPQCTRFELLLKEWVTGYVGIKDCKTGEALTEKNLQHSLSKLWLSITIN